jgi:hypothetical protein
MSGALQMKAAADESQKAIPLPKSPSEMFKPAAQAYKRRGLKIGMWGAPGTGKTHFGLTMPEPIYVISTEFGVTQLLHQFPSKDIHIAEVYVLEETEEAYVANPIKSLENLEKALAAVRNVEKGSVVIDSGSDLWSWMQSWLYREEEEKIKAGKFMQFNWGKANERIRMDFMKIISRPTAFLITGRAGPVYTRDGQVTGQQKPRWMMETGYYVDVSIETKIRVSAALPSPPGQPAKSLTREYVAVLEKCRYFRPKQMEFIDLDYPKLADHLKDKVPPGVL